jgi:hypothetical protein
MFAIESVSSAAADSSIAASISIASRARSSEDEDVSGDTSVARRLEGDGKPFFIAMFDDGTNVNDDVGVNTIAARRPLMMDANGRFGLAFRPRILAIVLKSVRLGKLKSFFAQRILFPINHTVLQYVVFLTLRSLCKERI